MRPPIIPPLVFGDLKQWLHDNRAKIGRQTLDPATVVVAAVASDAKTDVFHDNNVPIAVSNPQPIVKKVSFCTASSTTVTKQSTQLPKKQKTLAFFTTSNKDGIHAKAHQQEKLSPPLQHPSEKLPQDEPPSTPTDNKSRKKQRVTPKAPIGTPQITLIHHKPTHGTDDVLKDFNCWQTLRATATLSMDLLPPNKTARVLCAATFEDAVIDQLTQMYHFKVLPGGIAVGTSAMCEKLQQRGKTKPVPAFLPTKAAWFGNKQREQQAVREQFSSLWFRVCFVNKTNKMVHFKDLIKENKAEALKPLLSALFTHLAHGDEQIQRVMMFALDTILTSTA